MNALRRNEVCKVKSDQNDIIFLLYVTTTNRNPIQGSEEHSVLDTAGYFTSETDALNVAECLNRLIPLHHVYGIYKRVTPYVVSLENNYRHIWYDVSAWYDTVGHLEPREYASDIIFSIAKTKQQLNYTGARKWMNHNDVTFIVKGPYIKRYRVNDIMPTMSMNDYDLINHKERFNEVVENLKLLPGSHDTRRRGRMLHRKIPNIIQHSDSSDSEDESKWKRVTGRSLTTKDIYPLIRPLRYRFVH